MARQLSVTGALVYAHCYHVKPFFLSTDDVLSANMYIFNICSKYYFCCVGMIVHVYICINDML